MNTKILIGLPLLEDVEMMVGWGRENRQLWASERGEWYSPETIREWINDPQKDIILVARDGTKLIGMCLTFTLREWAYCSSLFITKEYRGQGIGTKLLEETEVRLKKKGIYYLGFLTEPTNEEARRFYQKKGYQEGFDFVWIGKNL